VHNTNKLKSALKYSTPRAEKPYLFLHTSLEAIKIILDYRNKVLRFYVLLYSNSTETRKIWSIALYLYYFVLGASFIHLQAKFTQKIEFLRK